MNSPGRRWWRRQQRRSAFCARLSVSACVSDVSVCARIYHAYTRTRSCLALCLELAAVLYDDLLGCLAALRAYRLQLQAKIEMEISRLMRMIKLPQFLTFCGRRFLVYNGYCYFRNERFLSAEWLHFNSP